MKWLYTLITVTAAGCPQVGPQQRQPVNDGLTTVEIVRIDGKLEGDGRVFEARYHTIVKTQGGVFYRIDGRLGDAGATVRIDLRNREPGI